jgi:nitroimidazol reductase NimA-like FMN-containing flavoprotein (pyridoxamine 5'-phosphate oxidase superfamily)
MPKEFVVSTQEMEKLLNGERIGYLGMTTDNNPYVIPLTYAYNKEKYYFMVH